MKKMERLAKLDVVAHSSNLSIWESAVDHEFEANLGYIARLYLKRTKAKMRKLALENKHGNYFPPSLKSSLLILLLFLLLLLLITS